jgi:hypothetical protein
MYAALISGFGWIFVIAGGAVALYVLLKLLPAGIARLQKMVSGSK